MNKELTSKQKQFCREYVIDLNGTQAAIRAGYSAKSAQMQSSRMLLKDVIYKYIKKLRNQQRKRTELSADKVLYDIEDTRVRARASNDYRAELKASELQGRHLAMFIDRQRVGGEDGGPVAIRVIKQYLGGDTAGDKE